MLSGAYANVPVLSEIASVENTPQLDTPSIKQTIANLKESAYKREVNLKKELFLIVFQT